MARPSGPRAGFWRRFAATLIDGLLYGIPVALLVALLEDGYEQNTSNGLTWLVGLVYYSYFEGSTGQTPGKRLLGIRVVDAGASDGRPIGYGRAAIRFLMSVISGLALLIGYLWMLWDREKQTWHDKVASAYVVPADAVLTGVGADPDVSGTTFER